MLLGVGDDGAGGAHAPARPDVDVLNRKKQTPLMLAAMHGRTDCVLRLLDAGANVRFVSWSWMDGLVPVPDPVPVPDDLAQILMFDSAHARTCLHHAAYYGHADCLQAILSAAKTAPVADSWYGVLASSSSSSFCMINMTWPLAGASRGS
jgi:E3 ubiquitin-protein ligase XBAT32/33